jgi:hypothetical protein
MQFLNTESIEGVIPSARDIRGAAPVVPLASEPAPKLVVDAPLPEPLAFGRVVIQYRTENLGSYPFMARPPSMFPPVSDTFM